MRSVKRLFSIVMLIIFLLNVFGYYGIFVGLQFRNDLEANKWLDESKYSGADEVTLRIPISIPYLTDSKDFERVEGDFVHQGEVYRLLKQKYAGDTLTIVCVRDADAKKINQDLADYVKTFSDKPVNAKQQGAKSLMTFSKDYVTSTVSLEGSSSGWNLLVPYVNLTRPLISSILTGVKHPPRA